MNDDIATRGARETDLVEFPVGGDVVQQHGRAGRRGARQQRAGGAGGARARPAQPVRAVAVGRRQMDTVLYNSRNYRVCKGQRTPANGGLELRRGFYACQRTLTKMPFNTAGVSHRPLNLPFAAPLARSSLSVVVPQSIEIY